MIPDYGENTYKILNKIIKINFKAQIKDSGIELKKLYKMTDLESGKEDYLLVTNGNSIRFVDEPDFIQKFIMFLKSNIADFNQQYKDLRERANEAVVDETAIFMEDEYIGFCGNKQLTLLNKMREFRGKNKNVG